MEEREDYFRIQNTVDSGEMTEACDRQSTEHRTWMPGQAHALPLYPAPIGVVQDDAEQRIGDLLFIAARKRNLNLFARPWRDVLVAHAV